MSNVVDVTLASDQSEGTQSHVRAWLRAAGDSVTENEPLLEIETDKVTVEVPAPCSGVLLEILKPVDEEVGPGAVLGRIRTGGSGSVTTAPAASTPTAAPGAAPAATPAVESHRPATPAAGTTSMSPAVRRLLAEHQLSPTDVTASGEGGRITIDDVLRHAAGGAATAPARVAPAGVQRPAEAADMPPARIVAHSRMRRQIAARMSESLLHTAPHVTTLFEVDLGAVLAHRDRLRAGSDGRGSPPSLTAYFLAACVDALRAVPELNARWTTEAMEYYERLDIGVATALDDGGLVVPVIRDLAALDLAGIARELADRVARARAGQLAPADVRGGTFTISNHGVSGSLLAAPIIINQPQSGILGIGKLEKRAVVLQQDGREVVAVRPRCYVTLTIDHRVLDGARANRFLQVLAQRLEHWEG